MGHSKHQWTSSLLPGGHSPQRHVLSEPNWVLWMAAQAGEAQRDPAAPLSSWVTLDRLLNSEEPQLPHL